MQLPFWIITGSAPGRGARFFVARLGAVWLGHLAALHLHPLKG